MIKVALIGAGKMGLSHLSILGAHPDVQIVGVCDTSRMVMDVIEKYASYPTFSDYEKMMEKTAPDAAFIAVPTKLHFRMVKSFLTRKINIFAEKPLCLMPAESAELVKLATENNCVNQVGYHNKFVGTFREVKRLVNEGCLGDIYHFVGEAYGPVVVKKKQDTWRSDPSEGGGCLMDYASHIIDLVNDILAPIQSSKGSLLKPIYSNNVEDSVYSLLELSSGATGVLSVNWSDDTFRKMSTTITIIGTQGKIISDANELKIYLKGPKFPNGYSKGWNVKYITDLTEGVDFFLRGEEYSAQIDYFIKACAGKVPNTINTFQTAWQTDNAISIIKNSSK
jgi:predicted dehydrogenase